MLGGLLFSFLVSCTVDTNQNLTNDLQPSPKSDSMAIVLLKECLEAHGGLALWNEFDGLSYTMVNNGKSVEQLTHLKDRRAYLSSETFELGFDGKDIWAYPNMEELPGKSAAFYYNLDFYFVALPFVLADPGVILSYGGIREINGVKYPYIRAGYESNVGLSPEDSYELYIHPETKMLDILTYSVTYFDQSKKDQLNAAKVYSEYIDVQGIKLATKMENYRWNDGQIGEATGMVRNIKDLTLIKDMVEKEKMFIKPENAVIDQSL